MHTEKSKLVIHSGFFRLPSCSQYWRFPIRKQSCSESKGILSNDLSKTYLSKTRRFLLFCYSCNLALLARPIIRTWGCSANLLVLLSYSMLARAAFLKLKSILELHILGGWRDSWETLWVEFPLSLNNHVSFNPWLLYSSTPHSLEGFILLKTG